MGKAFWILVFVLGLSRSLSIADPQGRGKGSAKGKSTEQKKDQTTDEAQDGKAMHAFGKEQERIIRNWFSDQSNLDGLPPGLAKRQELPPGLQRQLHKNGTLPPRTPKTSSATAGRSGGCAAQASQRSKTRDHRG